MPVALRPSPLNRIRPPARRVPEAYAPGSPEDMALGAAMEAATWAEYRIRSEAERRFGNPEPTVLSPQEIMHWAVATPMPPQVFLTATDLTTTPLNVTFGHITTNGIPIGTGTFQHANPIFEQQREYIFTEMAANTTIRSADIQFNLAMTAPAVFTQQFVDTAAFANMSMQQFNTALHGLSEAVAPMIGMARKKAKRLLMSNLTDYQRRMYRKMKYFHVVSDSGKKYRIKHGDTQNVFLLEKGAERWRYCIHPSNVPVEDAMLAQKLLLETDEKRFLKIANRSAVLTPQTRPYTPNYGMAV